jgi:hypothetical protein
VTRTFSAEELDNPTVRFEQADGAVLKGITEPAPLFRPVIDGGP